MGISDNYRRIRVFLGDKDKKPKWLIISEIFKLWRIKGSFPIHYIGRFLYRKEFTNPEDYMDMKEYRSFIYSKKNNEEQYVSLLSNKFLFSLICEKYNLPSARVVSYNQKNSFFLSNNLIIITSANDLIDYFKDVFERNKTDKLFLKSFCGYGGKEVFLLEHSRLEEQLSLFGPSLLKNSYIHQEAIAQHEELNKIYPDSVNTLRVETYIDDTGNPNILGTFLRFGSGGNVVDNVGSGGFFVPADVLTGRLKEKGIKSMILGGQHYTEHPDTNFKFINFQIPYFSEALLLAKEFTKYIPNKLAGWDIAITPDGPLMLEGNHTPGITAGEMAYGGYVTHPLYQDMMSNLEC